MPRPKKHVHQYQGIVMGKNGNFLYKCMLPDCPHFLPVTELAIGRSSICWGGCGNVVTITPDMVGRKLQKPRCDNCREERKQRIFALQSIPVMSAGVNDGYEGEEYEE